MSCDLLGLDRQHHRYSSGSDSLQSTNSFTSFINVINLTFLLWEVKTCRLLAKYYAQDTGNQYSILGRLICLPDCDKTSENESGNL
jgi:hypothetical protein